MSANSWFGTVWTSGRVGAWSLLHRNLEAELQTELDFARWKITACDQPRRQRLRGVRPVVVVYGPHVGTVEHIEALREELQPSLVEAQRHVPRQSQIDRVVVRGAE